MASPFWQPLSRHAFAAPAPLFVVEVNAAGFVERGTAAPGAEVLVGTRVPEPIYGALQRLDGDARPLGEVWEGIALAGVRRPGGGFVVFGAPPAGTSFEALVEHLPMLVVQLNPDETVRYANPAAHTLLGVPPADLLGQSFWDTLVYPEDRWKRSQVQQELQERHAADASLRLLRTDGDLRLTEVHLNLLDGGIIGAVVLDLTEQSEMVDALQHSEALYDTFLEQSPVGLVHLDATGTVTFENFRFRQIVGEEAEDAWIGRSVFAIAGTDGLFASAVKRLLSGMQVSGFDVRFEPAGRPPRRLLLNGAPIRQEDSHVVGAVLMFQDVTQERAQADEVALRDRFARAEGALREAVFAQESEAAFLREAARVLASATGTQRVAVFLPAGGADEVFVPRTRWGDAPELFDGRTLTRAAADVAEAVRTRMPVYLHESGGGTSLRPGAVRERLLAPFFERDELLGFFVAERTMPGENLLGGLRRRLVADLVRVFETLLSWLRSTDRFRLTVSTIEDCLFNYVVDEAGRRRYLFVTPQVERITGQPVEALRDGPGVWSGLVDEPESEAALAAHTERLRQGHESEAVYTIRRATGERRTVRERATPFHADDGALYAIGILSDVTEQEQARQVLLTAKLAAEQASRDKTAFIQTLSHELRTPLGAITGFAELLETEVRDLADASPQLAEFAATIRERARATLTLVNDLFELTSFDSGASDVKRVPVALHEAAARVAERLAEKARPGVRLQTDLAPVHALADPVRSEQVIQNLLSNAFKFTHAGTVSVSTRAEGDQAVVEVRDTGIGISEAYMERLFTPFVQEDQRLNREYEGTGLGLALVKRVVDLMGGTIEAESRKGTGTTFVVRLPLASTGP
jgi:PAS domain S-box-containing protein